MKACNNLFGVRAVRAAMVLVAGLALFSLRSFGQPPTTLTVGVVQLALAPELANNRDKMVHFVREAKKRGCRVVVFPETALFSPEGTPRAERDAAIEVLRKAAIDNGVYIIFCVKYSRDDKERSFERLLVIDPQGNIIHTYDKLWGDARFTRAPGLFHIDKIPCAGIICADRWIRSVEDLPAVAGAKILFELSNNYDNEWIDDLGWYWYVPRAVRNEVFVIFANTARAKRPADGWEGHGHSVVVGPDGGIIAAAGEESDKLLVAKLDIARATGGEASARRNHPLFKSFWDLGLATLEGKSGEAVPHEPLYSPTIELKLAAAQMACSRRVEDNLAQMETMIREARQRSADVIVFPELALTGARAKDVEAITLQDLQGALERLQDAGKKSGMYVVFGLPWYEEERRHNCAAVIGPDGKLRTRHAQLVVDRAELFAPGRSARTMWFEIRGVPAVVSVGRDAAWSEIAEMAALRGAQVHLHLTYDRDLSPSRRLLRMQQWANLASFRTFTTTVNAASPAMLELPSAPCGGGSVIWEDFHRAKGGKAGGYAPHSAVRVAQAKQGPTILYATQRVPKENPQFRVLTERTNPQMKSWYALGARAVAQASSLVPQAGKPGRLPHGRIAWSADGNHNDPDDWIASPMALAIFAECGVKDRLVHFDYNCILPLTNPEWEEIHAESVLGAARHYGYNGSIFHDCRKNLEGAVNSITRAINESSAENPLYFIVAGPMEVPFLGIQKSNPEKRKFVYCISHSRWNDGFAPKYKFTHTKRSVIESGVNWVQIQDQNRLLSFGKYGQPSTKDEEWRPYHWMRDSKHAKVKFLWERMKVSTRPDPSDAGMAYFLMTGDEQADPAKLKRLLDDNIVPPTPGARTRIRLEAENFRDLDGFEVEDQNDKAASHRLYVKRTKGEAGGIRTRFNEPFTAATGRYDIDIRYAEDSAKRCKFTLWVNGTLRGSAWEASGKSGWSTHTVPNVVIRTGDEIAVRVESSAGRLDYVQLNLRSD